MTSSTQPGGWLSLSDIDTQRGWTKGTAFRAFRRLEPTLREGADFLLLRQREQAARIAALRAEGRVYASSQNVLLLSPDTAERLD